ncbi:hypothetical protein [Telluribacter sp.]|jgi:hypothetical protein|uniref:hypothetical protein n=1 Tax=Telluribacter sp. TaxID=1978767 RepID=UPI002E14D32E|nr:hypothetical protein [Telluribacter sp.]
MDRNELDDETKATKNTANSRKIWIWVIGAGVVLSLIGHFGGWWNHNWNMTPSTRPEQQVVPSDTARGDVIMNPDTMATDVRR